MHLGFLRVTGEKQASGPSLAGSCDLFVLKLLRLESDRQSVIGPEAMIRIVPE